MPMFAQLYATFCSRFAPMVTKAGRVKEQIRENFEEKKPQKILLKKILSVRKSCLALIFFLRWCHAKSPNKRSPNVKVPTKKLTLSKLKPVKFTKYTPKLRF